MQKAIQNELGLSPVEKDVIVLYDGERDAQTNDFWKVILTIYCSNSILK